jgi:hypothetical protein
MRRQLLMLALIGMTFLNTACQNTATQSKADNLPKAAEKSTELKTPNQSVERFLDALRDDDYEQIKRLTCLQSNDLTKYAPGGVNSWDIQQTTESFNESAPNERYPVAIVNVHASGSNSFWKVKAWESDAFFAHLRRYINEANARDSKLNAVLATTNSPTVQLKEMPSRMDASSEFYCVELIAPESEATF